MRTAQLLTMALVIPLLAQAATAQTTGAKSLPPPAVTPAVDGILAAFQTHPLVGIADAHLIAQELDFYSALVRDPRFAREVGNVAVEFGDAADQDIIDRYVNGEVVPYTELRKVWTDTLVTPFFFLGYANFFAQVRAVNADLPPAQRIHVWLGDPPMDWSKLKSRADYTPVPGLRDRYPADIITQQILAKAKKALVIYGTLHFASGDNLRGIVEQSHPNSFYVVTPYLGIALESSCEAEFEANAASWPRPALAAPVRSRAVLE